MINRSDIIGIKFGLLTVLEIIQPLSKTVDKQLYKCICDCGANKTTNRSNLKFGQVTSCGCKRLKSKREHHFWKGYGEISKRLWNTVQVGAKSRKLEFLIDIEYAWELFLKQNQKCALSGQDLVFAKCESLSRTERTASLDRIDSAKGYIKGNVQWVHKDINKIKSDLNEKEFIKLCKMIKTHNQK